MNKETRLVFAAAIVGELVMLGMVIAQNRSMKKNNEAAKKAIESAGELQGIMSNAIDTAVETLGRDDLDYDQKIRTLHEQFSFVHMIAVERINSREEEQ